MARLKKTDSLYLAPFSHSDGIRGASGGDLLTGPPVSGLNVLLGVPQMRADNLGVASIGLGADDLAFNFSEGLIPLPINLRNFMPAVAPAILAVVPVASGVPEPGSPACAALRLALLVRSGQRARPMCGHRRAVSGDHQAITCTISSTLLE